MTRALLSLVLAAAIVTVLSTRALATVGRDGWMNGIDANYALEMAAAGRTWSGRADPFPLFAGEGVTWARIRIWTPDEGVNGLAYATATALRAQEAGLAPYLVYFLSEGWADFVKQPSPAAWEGLDDTSRAAAIEAYSRRTTEHLRAQGVRVTLVEVGNEIDFGVAGVFEEEWAKRVSIPYMRAHHWPRMATLLLAAQRGVLSVAPDARFVLHLSRWNDAEYTIEMVRTLLAAGVRVDHVGLSYFPTSVTGPEQSLDFLGEQVTRIRAAVDRDILFAEYAYPSRPSFGGQFAAWNQPVAGYPLSPDGQRRWIRSFLAWARGNPDVLGAIYWSPEWYTSEMWSAFALFDAAGRARPGLSALGAGR